MKTLVRQIIIKTSSVLVKLIASNRAGQYLLYQLVTISMEKVIDVYHKGMKLKFSAPNQICDWRAKTFSSKEPETLEWVDSIPNGSVLWDIGANIGLYSCYAAIARKCNVFAFEPSVFNLESLARNIYLNDLVGKVTIVPLPLSDSPQISTLNMTSTEWGGALSSFGQLYGDDGQPMKKIFDFRTIGLTMNDAIHLLRIPQPEYIKMDVDGIEHLIIRGGEEVLRKVKGLLIEVNEDFEKQAKDVDRYLTAAGLVLKEKRHSEMFDDSVRYGRTYNQIWYQPV